MLTCDDNYPLSTLSLFVVRIRRWFGEAAVAPFFVVIENTLSVDRLIKFELLVKLFNTTPLSIW